MNVQGCGKGYDVTMLALHGFDVFGLEVSLIGGEVARKHAKAELVNPSEYNFANPGYKPDEGPGSVEIIVGDFFKRDWEADCMSQSGEKFDLIYDYTVSCAHLKQQLKFVPRLTCLQVSVCPVARNEKRLGSTHERVACTKWCIGLRRVPSIQELDRSWTTVAVAGRSLELTGRGR